MQPFGRILIVDDDASFLATYRDILGEEGYAVETASTRAEALRRLDEADWDIVLLDQKLRGSGGPDEGIELLTETLQRSPGARPIIVTAYARPDAVELAFERGAWDYLEKAVHFEALLRAKVRNASEASRDRWLARMDREATESAIRDLWADLRTETDPHRKGKLLEDLIVLVFRTIPGFGHVEARRRNEIEELDVVIRNESRDPVWCKEPPYLFVECKNWSRPVSTEDFDHFFAKLGRRYGRGKLGLFVAPAGFSAGFRGARTAHATQDTLVVLAGPAEFRELVEGADRNAILKRLHQAAVLAANGRSNT